jgi:hypothetical protein
LCSATFAWFASIFFKFQVWQVRFVGFLVFPGFPGFPGFWFLSTNQNLLTVLGLGIIYFIFIDMILEIAPKFPLGLGLVNQK